MRNILRNILFTTCCVLAMAAAGCTTRTETEQPAAKAVEMPQNTVGDIMDAIAMGKMDLAKRLASGEPALVAFLEAVMDPTVLSQRHAYDLLQNFQHSGFAAQLAEAYGLTSPPASDETGTATPSLTAVKMAQRQGDNAVATAYIQVIAEGCRLATQISANRQLLIDARSKPAVLREAGYTAEGLYRDTEQKMHQYRLAMGPGLLNAAGAASGLPLEIDTSDAGTTIAWIDSLGSGFHGLKQEVDAAIRRQREASSAGVRHITVPNH